VSDRRRWCDPISPGPASPLTPRLAGTRICTVSTFTPTDPSGTSSAPETTIVVGTSFPDRLRRLDLAGARRAHYCSSTRFGWRRYIDDELYCDEDSMTASQIPDTHGQSHNRNLADIGPSGPHRYCHDSRHRLDTLCKTHKCRPMGRRIASCI
jgi:hypothetical protein